MKYHMGKKLAAICIFLILIFSTAKINPYNKSSVPLDRERIFQGNQSGYPPQSGNRGNRLKLSQSNLKFNYTNYSIIDIK